MTLLIALEFNHTLRRPADRQPAAAVEPPAACFFGNPR